MTDLTRMINWINSKHFPSRQNAEAYILGTSSKISRGMQKALDEVYGVEEEFTFFPEPQPISTEVPIQEQGVLRRILGTLRGLFG